MTDIAAPPPTYSGRRDVNDDVDSNVEVQMLICPYTDFQFQKGYLGVEGERATIEGEVQVKGAHPDRWDSLTLSLSATESFGQSRVELNFQQMTLYSRSRPSSSSSTNIPSSIPFSLPLTSDTAQCIHTPRSSLLHTLTATLHPVDPRSAPLSRSTTVHTRRFSSHRLKLDVQPRTVVLESPTRVEVQVPRTVYRSDEIIPVYFTIPPPERSVVLDQGYILRNVRAEVICKIQISDNALGNEIQAVADPIVENEYSEDSDSSSSLIEPPSAAFLVPSEGSFFSHSFSNEVSEESPDCNVNRDNFYEKIVSRSGISCRFNSSRTVRLRLLLSASSQNPFLHMHTADPSDAEQIHGQMTDEMQCTSISQSTLIHTVSFYLRLHVTYLQSLSHSEFVSNHSLSLIILPPPAQLPEVDPSVDVAYRKKHDQPPAKTTRREDLDLFSYGFDENHAGPSAYHPNAPPPPFDDAPPPFSSSTADSSASSRLPTFLESESELHVPFEEHPVNNTLSLPQNEGYNIEGEGVFFGFPASEQYDGHSDELRRAVTPPPAIDMSRDDTDVTQLAGLLNQVEHALDALTIAYDQAHGSPEGDSTLPPPPPPMDDPSDPPPSIDSDYRTRVSEPPPSIDSHYHLPSSGLPASTNFSHSPVAALSFRGELRSSVGDGNHRSHSQSASPHRTETIATDTLRSSDISTSETMMMPSPSTQAPPPYLNSMNMEEQEGHVTHPPPYIDFLPSNTHN